MTNTKKRLKFECWNCEREYTMLVKNIPKLLVACPYCEEEAIVDLTLYLHSAHKRLGQSAKNLDLESLDLPDVVPVFK